VTTADFPWRRFDAGSEAIAAAYSPVNDEYVDGDATFG
jgi:hypothetical protein